MIIPSKNQALCLPTWLDFLFILHLNTGMKENDFFPKNCGKFLTIDLCGIVNSNLCSVPLRCLLHAGLQSSSLLFFPSDGKVVKIRRGMVVTTAIIGRAAFQSSYRSGNNSMLNPVFLNIHVHLYQKDIYLQITKLIIHGFLFCF